jgi:hypothetical protein
MGGLDRLDWADGSCFRSYGVAIGVRTDDADWLPRLQERLPPGWDPAASHLVDHLYSVRRGGAVPDSRIRRFHVVYAGPNRVSRTLDESEALDAFESWVRLDVMVSTTQRIFVHAGVVGWRGRAIVVPGASGTGKSRLVESLVRAGATYYSDEFAVIDDEGLVHPFAQPLKRRQDAGGVSRLRAADLGAAEGTEPLPIGIVVSTSFQAGASWRPRQATSGESLLALLGHTVQARLAPTRVMTTLTCVAECATTLIGPRGEAERVSGELLMGRWPSGLVATERSLARRERTDT